jgi:hypothetical protein
MKDKFTDFRHQMKQAQEEVAAKALKRACYKKLYAFKKKENEEQVAFNAKVNGTVTEVEGALCNAASPSPASSLQRANRLEKSSDHGCSTTLEGCRPMFRL